MEHRVAVRANGSEIVHRIDDVLGANRRQRCQMMNVNVIVRNVFSVAVCEAEPAHDTMNAPVRDTSLTRGAISFVHIYDHRSHCAFDKPISTDDFLSRNLWRTIRCATKRPSDRHWNRRKWVGCCGDTLVPEWRAIIGSRKNVD